MKEVNSALDSMLNDMNKLLAERDEAIKTLEKNRDILKAQLDNDGALKGKAEIKTAAPVHKAVEQSAKTSLRQKLSAYKQKISQQRNPSKTRINQPEL